MIRLVLFGVGLRLLMSIIYEGAKLWLLVKPWKRFKAWRVKRAMRSWEGHHLDAVPEEFNSDRKESGMALDTGLRTSSNMVIAGGIVNAIVELAQAFYPELVISPELRTYATLAICWLVARFSKTPEAPKAL